MANKDTVLIVEDGIVIAPQYETMVKNAGHKCELVATFDDAKQKLAQGNIAAVILDNDFPKSDPFGSPVNGNGAELLRFMRDKANATLNDLPVLMNSARFDATSIAEIDKAAGVPAGTTAHNINDHMIIDNVTEAVPKNHLQMTRIVTDFLQRHIGKGQATGSPSIP